MKKLRFLLLDAGPIIKLFELGIWESFIARCDVTITATVADQAQYAVREDGDIAIDLDGYRARGQLQIVDTDVTADRAFYDQFDAAYQTQIHDGEKQTLAFLCRTAQPWHLCAADGAVFRVLGRLGRGEQGTSLEEVLLMIGLARDLPWQYTREFREKYTKLGQIDAVQGGGVRGNSAP